MIVRLFRWIVQRALTPGEPPVDRTRKELAAPMFTILGFVASAWVVLMLLSAQPESATKRAAYWINRVAVAVFAAALLPAGVYIVYTRKISKELCAYPVAVASLGVLLMDLAALLNREQSVFSLNVVVLDCLLLCGDSDGVTKCVVAWTLVWILVRSVLEWENVTGDDCFDNPPRFSSLYVQEILSSSCIRSVVLLADFRFTRGFANSMNTQRAMVEASIRLSELAAVRLSRYEADETKALLEGPDGEQLPPGLRTALLQLVANLAQYRPYLPQSCLGEDERASDGRSHMPDEADLRRRQTEQCASAEVDSFSEESSVGVPHQLSGSWNQLGSVSSSFGSEVKMRNVSLVAVNSRSFLRAMQERMLSTKSFVHGEIEAFAGEVAAERGVVDVVCGDHMAANFNASRISTTHKLSAARVAWMMVQGPPTSSRRSFSRLFPVDRTACACSGVLLSGDFGTTEVRRFMLIGSAFNTLQCLERVSAQLGVVLVDESVGADGDLSATFFTKLMERLCYAKRGPRPFLVWQLTGRREAGGGPEEWMYEMERQVPNPHESWNRLLKEWLDFGKPLAEEEVADATFAVSALTRPREQSHLIEATVAGAGVAFTLPSVVEHM
eukprot:TRINITY_DN20671_c0_g1_i1.p1 TRINITY_DN20671_c0_g1~~TRINITY_DN20671_c0_g1_i1.p1  ORF type:complete len:613 (+),score=72.90 TRINITY_DN20671_c0_g1_i1:54-1892(+)